MSMLTYIRAPGGTTSATPVGPTSWNTPIVITPVAVVDRVPDLRLVAPEAADADLGQAQHVLHRGDVTERLAVGEAEIVDEGRIVGVGVEVDNVQRCLVLVPFTIGYPPVNPCSSRRRSKMRFAVCRCFR